MALVKGFDPAVSGQQPETDSGEPVPVGVWGDSNVGGGVFGTSGVLPPGNRIPIDRPAGVEGHGVNGPGVTGRSLTDLGVFARCEEGLGLLAQSGTSSGVLGVSFGPANSAVSGLFGSSTTGADGVIGFVGDATGVVGSSVRGTGVQGTSGSGTAVFAQTFGGNGPALRGQSAGGTGCDALTFGDGAFGVRGVHFSSGGGAGILGTSLIQAGAVGNSIIGNGVEGLSFAGLREFPDVAAVRGQNTNGLAGLFVGRVRITGSLTKAGGGFLVDHPLDPANKYLSHSFVESPEMLNVYCGTVTTDKQGVARVKLPPYFEALNRDFCYQLTVIGDLARVAVSQEIKGNEFEIRSDPPGVKVCWQVTGVRKDAWAEANRIPCEMEKEPAQRGRYLHPELFKSPAAIHATTNRTPSELLPPLPEEIRDRAERMLADLEAGGTVDAASLRDKLGELRQAIEKRAADARSDLDERWRALQDLIARRAP